MQKKQIDTKKVNTSILDLDLFIVKERFKHCISTIADSIKKHHKPAPDHQKVEAYEEPEHPPAVRHQGAEGEGLLLSLHRDSVAGECGPQARGVGGWCDNRLPCNFVLHEGAGCQAFALLHQLIFYQAAKSLILFAKSIQEHWIITQGQSFHRDSPPRRLAPSICHENSLHTIRKVVIQENFTRTAGPI